MGRVGVFEGNMTLVQSSVGGEDTQGVLQVEGLGPDEEVGGPSVQLLVVPESLQFWVGVQLEPTEIRSIDRTLVQMEHGHLIIGHWCTAQGRHVHHHMLCCTVCCLCVKMDTKCETL